MSDRRFKRKLTPFICQEMLYDYVVGALDPERRQAVEEFLPTDAETRRKLAAIQLGFVYTKKLSNFEINPLVLRRLHEAETVLQMSQRQLANSDIKQKIFASLRLSPAATRGLAIAAGVVLMLVAGSSVPWRTLWSHRSHRGATESAATQGKNPVGEYGPVNIADHSEQPADHAASDGSGDEEGMAAPATAGETSGDESGDEGIPQTLAAAPPPPAVNVSVPVMNQPSAPSNQAKNPERGDGSAGDESATDRKDPAAKGFVYRAFMTLDNVEDVADAITHKIETLGGEKAGEVELGWKKNDGRYYHFAMPEANQETLMNQLRAYGPVRISKDPHPRIMPKGRVRIILWVDESKPDS